MDRLDFEIKKYISNTLKVTINLPCYGLDP